MNKLDLLGAVLANLINVLLVFLFIARLKEKIKIEYWAGIALILLLFPLAYLFYTGIYLSRPALYFVQIGLMILYLIVEWLLDYVLKIKFRQTKWLVILYVTLFFAATGGMIGVASLAGKFWMYTTIGTFFIMVFFAFYQRHKTGE